MSHNQVKLALLAGVAGSITGSLFVLSYLFLTSSDPNSAVELLDFFIYALIVAVSVNGTIPACLLVGVPALILSEKLFPKQPVKGFAFTIVFGVVAWLGVLGPLANKLLEVAYSDVLLLSPYAFCSSAALGYLAGRDAISLRTLRHRPN